MNTTPQPAISLVEALSAFDPSGQKAALICRLTDEMSTEISLLHSDVYSGAVAVSSLDTDNLRRLREAHRQMITYFEASQTRIREIGLLLDSLIKTAEYEVD